MIELKNVTLVCIDTKNKLESLSIMKKMSRLIKFGRCMYFTMSNHSEAAETAAASDRAFTRDDGPRPPDDMALLRISHIRVPPQIPVMSAD